MLGRKPLHTTPGKDATADSDMTITTSQAVETSVEERAPQDIAPVETEETYLSNHKLSGENLNTCFQKMEDSIVLRDTRTFSGILDSFLLVFELELAAAGNLDLPEKGLMWRVSSLQKAARLFRIASLRMGQELSSGPFSVPRQQKDLERFTKMVISYMEGAEQLVTRDVPGAEGWLRMQSMPWRIRRHIGETLGVLCSILQELSEEDALSRSSVMQLKHDRNEDILLWIFISSPDFAAACGGDLRKKLKETIVKANAFLDKRNFSILERPELHSLEPAQIYEVLAMVEQALLLSGDLDAAENR